MIAPCRARWQNAGFSFVKDEGTARLMDILLFGPLLLASGFMIPNLPKSLKVTLIGAGSFVIVWNGIGYLANLNESMRQSFMPKRPEAATTLDLDKIELVESAA